MLWIFKVSQIRIDGIAFDEQGSRKGNNTIYVALILNFHTGLTNHSDSTVECRFNHQPECQGSTRCRIILKFKRKRTCVFIVGQHTIVLVSVFLEIFLMGIHQIRKRFFVDGYAINIYN